MIEEGDVPRAGPLTDSSSPPAGPSAAPPPAVSPPDPGLGRGICVLVASDEALLRRSLARVLMAWGFEVLTAEGVDAALGLLPGHPVSAALVDFNLRCAADEPLVDLAARQRPGLEIVVMASAAQIDRAALCLRKGAFGLLSKPFVSQELVACTVSRAAELAALRAERSKTHAPCPNDDTPSAQWERSPAMRRTLRLATAAASADVPVLLVGEQGTGRKVIARWIHDRSARSARPLVVVDCVALPREAVRQALVEGAAFENAAGGTVVIDELSSMAPIEQASLLQRLEAGTAARVMATVSGAPKALVEAGEVRADLLYRLGVMAIDVPPLRRRKDDLPVIAYEVMNRSARRLDRDVTRISREAMRKLREHAWPGNLRELESVVERAVITARGATILPSDVSFERDDESEAPAERIGWPADLTELPFAEAKTQAVDLFERAYLAATIDRARGNISEAARQSGLDRSNFRRVLKKRSKRGAG
ncbi:MAG TPA: sigma 54-interacting transcriptional regulator [Polyangiaceae bacterium]|nr:sigma 54-interacting transcriptional regulator [Polyangiaceae bacterium]